MKKLYVGSLAPSVTENELRGLFEKFGPIITIKVIKDFETKQSRGFGFVELEDDQQAEAAISALNGADLAGRNIIVNEARPKASGGGGGGGSFRDGPRRGGGGGGGGPRGHGGGGYSRGGGGGGGRSGGGFRGGGRGGPGGGNRRGDGPRSQGGGSDYGENE